jgi:PIN domain nuclease of toxin-antitoxin system
MKILLDTHIFLWYITKDGRLPSEALNSIRQPKNEVYLSVVSLWEIIVKHRLDKLSLPKPPATYIPIQRARHQIMNLDLDEASVVQLAKLPSLHRDPFDRMLMCQAIQHNMTLASTDEQFQEYPVKLLP